MSDNFEDDAEASEPAGSKLTPEELETAMEELRQIVDAASVATKSTLEAALLAQVSAAAGKDAEAIKAADNTIQHLATVNDKERRALYLVSDLDLQDNYEVRELIAKLIQLRENAESAEERAEAVRPRPEIKLVVAYHDEQQVDAFMPLRWCINRLTADALRSGAERNLNYSVLLSIVHETAGEVDRHVVPLDAMMDYIRFTRPGKYAIHALVIYNSKKKNEQNKERARLLEKDTPRAYRVNLTQYTHLNEGSKYSFHPEWIEGNNGLLCHGDIDVEVPAEFFAKKPPAWVNSWAHCLITEQVVDQCSLRKRLIFAFTLQPFIVLFLLALKYVVLIPAYTVLKLLVAVFATLIGIRPKTRRQPDGVQAVNWKAVFGGLDSSVPDVWNPEDPVGFCYHHQQCEYSNHGGPFQFYSRKGLKRRSAFWWLLTPLFWVLNFGMPFLFVSRNLKVATELMTFIFVIAAIFTSLYSLVKWISETAKNQKKRPVSREEEEENRQKAVARKQKFEGTINKLLCETTPFEVAVSALPKERQTIRLRFQAIKAKVCRPFAY